MPQMSPSWWLLSFFFIISLYWMFFIWVYWDLTLSTWCKPLPMPLFKGLKGELTDNLYD
nr:ATP synthase F0 subunit 8 [Linognathus africanus]